MDKVIRDELNNTNLPWEVVQGKKHNKIFICNKLVGILPRSLNEGDTRTRRNTIAQIRRAMQTLSGV